MFSLLPVEYYQEYFHSKDCQEYSDLEDCQMKCIQGMHKFFSGYCPYLRWFIPNCFLLHIRTKRQAEDESGDIFENAQTICEVRYWSVCISASGDSFGRLPWWVWGIVSEWSKWLVTLIHSQSIEEVNRRGPKSIKQSPNSKFLGLSLSTRVWFVLPVNFEMKDDIPDQLSVNVSWLFFLPPY